MHSKKSKETLNTVIRVGEAVVENYASQMTACAKFAGTDRQTDRQCEHIKGVQNRPMYPFPWSRMIRI